MRKLISSAYGKVFWVLCAFCVVMAGLVVGKLYLGVESEKAQSLVIYRTEYKCGDALINTVDVSRSGLEAYLAGVAPEWGSPNSITAGHQFIRVDPGYCPDHARFRLVCIYKGYVAVFRGKSPDIGFLMKEYKDLPESALHPRDRDVLKTGLIIEGEPDEVDVIVAKHLEGIKE